MMIWRRISNIRLLVDGTNLVINTRFLKKLAACLRLIIMVRFRLLIMVRYGLCC